jgi:hypothetical protein
MYPRIFWSGVVCIFIGAGLLVGWGPTFLIAGVAGVAAALFLS